MNKIVPVCKLEDSEKEIEDSESLKIRVMDATANTALTTTPQKLTSILKPGGSQKSNDSTLADQPPSTSGTIPPIQNSQSTGPPSATSKLTKLTLPKFKAEVTQFKSFWSIFESEIHSIPTLKNSTI